MPFDENGDMVAKIGLDTSSFTGALAGLDLALGGLRTTLGAVAIAGGAAFVGIAAASGLAIDAASDLEDAWTGVTKTVDGTPEQMAALKSELLDLAKTVPVATDQLMATAEAAGQLGVQRDGVAAFTKTITDLSVSTNILGSEGAVQLARFMNIMETSHENVGNLGSSIVDLGNNFAASEAEILKMATNLAAAGKVAGLTESDILALGAALTAAGIKAEKGGTNFSNFLAEVQASVERGGEKLTMFAETAGMSADEFSQAWKDDPKAAIQSFILGLKDMSDSGEGVIQRLDDLGLSGSRMRQVLLSAAESGDMLGDAFQTANSAFKENTALTEEANKRYATTSSQVQILKNRVFTLAATFGEKLLPAVNDVLGALNALLDGDFAGFAAGMGSAAQTFAAAWRTQIENVHAFLTERMSDFDFSAAAAKAGELLTTAFGRAREWLSNVDWFEMGEKVGEALVAASKAFMVFLQNVNWVEVFKGMLAALAGVFQFFAGLFKEITLGLGPILVEAGKALWELAKDLGTEFNEGVVAGVKSAWDKVKAAFTWLKDKIVGWFKSLFDINSPSGVFFAFGIDMIMGLVAGIRATVDAARQAVVGFFGSIKERATALADDLKTSVQTKFASLRENVSGGLNAAKNQSLGAVASFVTGLHARFKSGTSALKTGAQAMFASVKDNVSAGLGAAVGASVGAVQSFMGRLSGAFRSAKGGLVGAVQDAIGSAVDKAWGLVGKLKDAFSVAQDASSAYNYTPPAGTVYGPPKPEFTSSGLEKVWDQLLAKAWPNPSFRAFYSSRSNPGRVAGVLNTPNDDFQVANAGALISALGGEDAARQTIRSLGGAAHGLEAIVSQPSLLLVGEHGRERVSVTPSVRPPTAKNGQAGNVFHISIHANDRRGGERAGRGLARELRRYGVM